MWECEWWCRLYKTDASIKSHPRENFPYRRPLSEEGLMQGLIDGRLFGYVQCDIEVPEHLGDYFSNFPPMFKNTALSKDVSEIWWKNMQKKKGLCHNQEEGSYQALF